MRPRLEANLDYLRFYVTIVTIDKKLKVDHRAAIFKLGKTKSLVMLAKCQCTLLPMLMQKASNSILRTKHMWIVDTQCNFCN